MTNKQRIMQAAMDSGIDIDETLYTYKEWKKRGYQVQKGEKAALKVELWIPKKRKVEAEDNDQEEEEISRFFTRVTSLFTSAQVKKIETKGKTA